MQSKKELPPADLAIQGDSLANAGKLEAREDSLELALALSLQAGFTTKVLADVETEAVESALEEDAADDPAIWYNSDDPVRSLVLGTDKNAGIYVYNLEGQQIQSRKVGEINNIDLRDGFKYGGKEVVLVAGSNRSNNCITLFTIDRETGVLSDSLINIPSGVDEVYGLCMYRNKLEDEFHVFVNGKGGSLEQWIITSQGGLHAELLRRTRLSSQPEGMVADDQSGRLYAGVEGEGIFRLDTDPEGDTTLYLIQGSTAENTNIAYDIEGLALFSTNQSDYLIASIQGNFSYAIFDLKGEGSYITSFIIPEGKIDGVEETDGLEIITLPLNKRFPMGILVVQDGFNSEGSQARSQNFKFISADKILDLLVIQ
ncbi:MAG: phytase [Bacteroidales bacterium]